MDTSEEYIDLCIKAWDIHDLWYMENGDFYYEQTGTVSKEFCVSIWSYGTLRCETSKGKIWLPKQDQLQNMVGVKHSTHLTPFLDFVAEIDASRPFNIKPRDYSMEQLWLAFVMYSVYGMIWNGIDWVVE